jgi:hypothetical protein
MIAESQGSAGVVLVEPRGIRSGFEQRYRERIELHAARQRISDIRSTIPHLVRQRDRCPVTVGSKTLDGHGVRRRGPLYIHDNSLYRTFP